MIIDPYKMEDDQYAIGLWLDLFEEDQFIEIVKTINTLIENNHGEYKDLRIDCSISGDISYFKVFNLSDVIFHKKFRQLLERYDMDIYCNYHIPPVDIKFKCTSKESTIEFYPSVKYEVVIATQYSNGYDYVTIPDSHMESLWMEFAKEYYDKTGIYVSAICNKGKALYNTEWGCPSDGEDTITFNCTANPAFIKAKDMKTYEKGVLYITGKIKAASHQHTITITKLQSDVCYLTDENNNELNNILKEEN